MLLLVYFCISTTVAFNELVSFTPPFDPLTFTENFRTSGPVSATKSGVRLTPNGRGKSGFFSTKLKIEKTTFELESEYEAFCQLSCGGGIGYWLSENWMGRGGLFGANTSFLGVGIFVVFQDNKEVKIAATYNGGADISTKDKDKFPHCTIGRTENSKKATITIKYSPTDKFLQVIVTLMDGQQIDCVRLNDVVLESFYAGASATNDQNMLTSYQINTFKFEDLDFKAMHQQPPTAKNMDPTEVPQTEPQVVPTPQIVESEVVTEDPVVDEKDEKKLPERFEEKKDGLNTLEQDEETIQVNTETAESNVRSEIGLLRQEEKQLMKEYEGMNVQDDEFAILIGDEVYQGNDETEKQRFEQLQNWQKRKEALDEKIKSYKAKEKLNQQQLKEEDKKKRVQEEEERRKQLAEEEERQRVDKLRKENEEKQRLENIKNDLFTMYDKIKPVKDGMSQIFKNKKEEELLKIFSGVLVDEDKNRIKQIVDNLDFDDMKLNLGKIRADLKIVKPNFIQVTQPNQFLTWAFMILLLSLASFYAFKLARSTKKVFH
ncbi:hypothetical protein EIN_222700 [Entamoeba invadens IP1]|uniref:L-type lectin-like domain-containing protein n=1 Tax=Entamoeba invadens IP1 TaxID=370355 RepID=A0A0A1U227_ENTIV|nr:hypothetical protein EIN_222700 [Entamoeba invadens IP1]ELP88107.1 hypothetical protein EIN_222700 [Entamoeba invadens IP1]|eukprot:XP_004254878.1 hypothetical protein EIN_222700 [Entamoeba invadens IP1]